ncbi:MAG: hypothetical protein NTU44_08960, partial [Bacteroidetes bacterium]|nr:hypothetical protein [Bacteroidota bacterium]
DRSDPKVSASVHIQYDFPNNIFSGHFSVMVNVAGVIRGSYPGNSVGTGYMYADAETWYIKVGRPARTEDEVVSPDQRMSVEIYQMFTAKAYMQVGKNLDPPPPIPQKVLSILNPATIQRNPALSTGDGFAFGAAIDFNLPKTRFLVFYAMLNGGIGFDFSLLNFGPHAYCEGAPPGSTIGINGWYASGALYAYLQGEFGIYIDNDWFPPEIKILDFMGAVLLRGGMPNPNWMQGVVAYHYNILAGLIQGDGRYEIMQGHECKAASENPVSGMEILADLNPSDGEQDVDVGILGLAAFNTEIGTEFQMDQTMSDQTTRTRTFRFVIDYFNFKKGSVVVPGTVSMANSKTQAFFAPTSFLDPQTDYTVNIRVHGEEFLQGSWKPTQRNDGSNVTEELVHHFRTGNYPDRIPDNNIQYSYPINRQRYYLQDECPDGFVKMKVGMPAFFTGTAPAGSTRKYIARFTPVDGGAPKEVPFTYSNPSATISFTNPKLMNATVYAVQILYRDEVDALQAINQPEALQHARANAHVNMVNISNLSELQSMLTPMTENTEDFAQGQVQVLHRRLDASVVRSSEKLLYLFYFRTSLYNSL